MSSVNKVVLVGRLGQDPEIRRTSHGDPIATLSVATSETWRDKGTGERKERTEWHRVVVFETNAAEFAEKYLKKGAQVYVEGSNATRKWTDNKGVERYTTEIVVKSFNGKLLSLDRASGTGRPPPADDQDDYGSTSTYGGADATGRSQAPAYDLDDEIPF